jgi:hypothetical protein
VVGSILPYDRSYDWGNSDIGIKQRLSYRFNYELPFGKSGSRMRKLAIAGWQANLLAFYQSGVPFTVLNTATPVPSNVSRLVTVDRPNTTGQPYAPANQNYTNWINFAAFALQPVGTVGNETRSIVRPAPEEYGFLAVQGLPAPREHEATVPGGSL